MVTNTVDVWKFVGEVVVEFERWVAVLEMMRPVADVEVLEEFLVDVVGT